MKNREHIIVLGSGVSGLTTAIVLLDAGYEVKIITKALPDKTTSAVAAAIWFPYEARPFHKVSEWSKSSFNRFQKLAKEDVTGVSFIPFTAYLDSEEEPWWLDALPSEFVIDNRVKSPVNPNHRGYRLSVPLIESPVYLKYLLNRFKNSGGILEEKEITDLSELSVDTLIVNCSGLGAKELLNDSEIYPIQGQVVKVEANPEINGMATEYPMGDGGNEMAYIIPRRDGIVLGGSAVKGVNSIKPDADLTKRIIHYCSSFEPDLKELSVIETKVGLRPGRTEVRLERDVDLPVIHNYGHGGAGYTVSWGCAEEVLKLI